MFISRACIVVTAYCPELFPKRQILDPLKLIEFADYKIKIDENGRKYSKRVEKTVGKGEIARFSLSVFKRLVLQTWKN